jgi:phage terminase large subunit-like protein/rubredoxin
MSINVGQSDLTRIVVAVDPAATANEDSDDTGIIVVARGPHQPETCQIPYCPGHGYVLDDQTCHLLPAEWAKLVVRTYDHWMADRIVAETNNGGDMVGTLIHAVKAGVPYSKVTATRGKVLRAEPCSALYEQGRVHHVGSFPDLEQEQATWTPDSNWSPNRVDALVWGLTFLGLVGSTGDAFITAWKDEVAQRPTHQTPEALRRLPKHVSVVEDRPIAKEKCKGGKHHRFQEWPDGSFTCPVCGGRKADNEEVL